MAQKKKKVIGYTTGVFDLFHIGHLNILERARKNCDYLIVGVTTDKLATARKNKQPIIPFNERVRIIGGLRCVDLVVPQDSMDKIAAWRKHNFDVMFVGDDWKNTRQWIEYEKQFSTVGVKIKYFPYTRTTSSTLLKKVLRKITNS